MKFAIIGAGMAGLTCAETLRAGGHRAEIFDKGRWPGGRMATRRVATPVGDVAFDHGAQYFTARDPAFLAQAERWAADGHAARWPAARPNAWVGTPGMNAVIKALAETCDVHWNCRIVAIRRTGRGWTLDPFGHRPFDGVIVATPAEQAGPLLQPHDPAMAAVAQACPSEPCWTAMLAFDAPVAIARDVIRDTGIIGWAARNSAKPGRDGPETWVVQAGPEWSREHLEDPEESVVVALIAALAACAGGVLPAITVRIGHRWRYARVQATTCDWLWNDSLRIGAVGDWLAAPRVEGAWRSGRLLGTRILQKKVRSRQD